ncbi:hypothetical protein N7462_005267 [Penicillium macrosclerotiorum]|uniref:uncharacterized protein n=1 Tax=Penicillium macrosclerotiorum TaxID=303699 RepID=UPI00254701EF|nr:uncharacterized protein N7462_005267 [Penicillium macrosclerotiorum]KAJ5690875.1 hypothetical protein N7462_005267 [Penicillium macrosclerotiorum]
MLIMVDRSLPLVLQLVCGTTERAVKAQKMAGRDVKKIRPLRQNADDPPDDTPITLKTTVTGGNHVRA